MYKYSFLPRTIIQWNSLQIPNIGTIDLETFKNAVSNNNLIQNSQAVKKECGPEKGYGEKRCEIQGGGQEMAVMVG